ncbi:MAG: hypothetical protein AAF433_05720 [Bacteroidota bacterium]
MTKWFSISWSFYALLILFSCTTDSDAKDTSQIQGNPTKLGPTTLTDSIVNTMPDSNWRLKELPKRLAPSTGGLMTPGDFDGDGQFEILAETIYDQKADYVLNALPIGPHYEEYENCVTVLQTSDSILSPLFLPEARWGISVLLNEGNIDGIKGDELSILLRWPQSCWHGFFLYSYQEDSWQLRSTATVNVCLEEEYTDIFQHSGIPNKVHSLEYGWNEDYTVVIRTLYLVDLETTEKQLLEKIAL